MERYLADVDLDDPEPVFGEAGGVGVVEDDGEPVARIVVVEPASGRAEGRGRTEYEIHRGRAAVAAGGRR